MLNTEDFVRRLEVLLSHYGLSAAAFSDKIGVQRSSVSHLLSGRNKPSLDFILKITSAFPEIDLDWLVTGSGSMLRRTGTESNSNFSFAVAEKIIVFYPDGTFTEYKPRK